VAAFESPFDYANQAEVLIVTDVPKGDIPALAGAYGRLIEASGGGALGLFTAIRRLRAVHGRIADRMARLGLPLYAQHVDPIDTGTLVDIFRDDPHASLLGTDALRDGVDVPGQSLRLVIMEQVPWPKPSILHRARRAAHPDGGQAHDDRIIRAPAQAFGRLIRGAGDRGHFVVLSSAFPSRLLGAFPPARPFAAARWMRLYKPCAAMLVRQTRANRRQKTERPHESHRMKTIGLFRHAKSDWGDARARFRSPAEQARPQGAPLMGRHIDEWCRHHGLKWGVSPRPRCARPRPSNWRARARATSARCPCSGTGGCIWPAAPACSISCANWMTR
jgi:hypothetical protein